MYPDVVADAAVLYGRVVGPARYAAAGGICSDAGVGEIDALDSAAFSYISKETLVHVAFVTSGVFLIDAYAADGVAGTVERAAEGVVVGANGGVVVLVLGIVPIAAVAVGDVVAENEVHAAVVLTVVDESGQMVEIAGVLDGVWVVFGAVARGEVSEGDGDAAEGGGAVDAVDLITLGGVVIVAGKVEVHVNIEQGVAGGRRRADTIKGVAALVGKLDVTDVVVGAGDSEARVVVA